VALLFLFRFLFQSCCLFLEANPLPVVAAEGEESCGRFYCLVKSMRNGDWLPIGPGDLLLAKDVTTSKARVVFFQKEDLLKARINCWLHPLALAERNTFVNLLRFHQQTEEEKKKKTISKKMQSCAKDSDRGASRRQRTNCHLLCAAQDHRGGGHLARPDQSGNVGVAAAIYFVADRH